MAIVIHRPRLELLEEALTEKQAAAAALKMASAQEKAQQKMAADAEKYAKSQNYTREGTRFGLIETTVMLPVTIAFILLGGFKFVDHLARVQVRVGEHFGRYIAARDFGVMIRKGSATYRDSRAAPTDRAGAVLQLSMPVATSPSGAA